MKKLKNTPLILALFLAVILTTSGCYVHEEVIVVDPPCNYGVDGYAGNAFFGLEWDVVQPAYVWTNNTAIPPVFRYGDYYQSGTGTFQLYYEGEFRDGCCIVDYFWEVDFDVWRNPGSAGGCGFNGQNGVDSWLMLICGPNGPVDLRTNKTSSASDKGTEMNILSDTGSEIIVEFKTGDVTVQATYTKLDASKKAELDLSHVKTAE